MLDKENIRLRILPETVKWSYRDSPFAQLPRHRKSLRVKHCGQYVRHQTRYSKISEDLKPCSKHVIRAGISLKVIFRCIIEAL